MLWQHSQVFLTVNNLIKSHCYHDATRLLDTSGDWSGTDDELEEVAKSSINACDAELFSVVVKAIKTDATNWYRAHNGITIWTSNMLLSLPDSRESALLWAVRNDSIAQVKFLLAHETIWMTDFLGKMDHSILDDAYMGCLRTDPKDSIRQAIEEILISAGAREVVKLFEQLPSKGEGKSETTGGNNSRSVIRF